MKEFRWITAEEKQFEKARYTAECERISREERAMEQMDIIAFGLGPLMMVIIPILIKVIGG